MRQKAFGVAANAANVRARTAALAAAAVSPKSGGDGGGDVFQAQQLECATDPEEAELATRAARRDVAAAAALS